MDIDEAPPVLLELLSHPIRWRLARALADSDRRVGELVAATGERQNLVSYHLGLLRRSGIVVERRSSADARDVYYTLDLIRVQSDFDRSAAAIHPALRTLGAVEPRGRRLRSKVLFLCTGNSARSLIAEAILRVRSSGSIEVSSAGPRPASPHPLAIRVLRSRRIPTGGLRSKSVEEFAATTFDHVVTLCDIAREECPDLTGEPNRIHWSLADPATAVGSEVERLRAFEAAATELDVRLRFALPVLSAPRPKATAA